MAELCRRSPAAGSRLVEAIARAHAEAGGEGVDEAAMPGGADAGGGGRRGGGGARRGVRLARLGREGAGLPPESFCVAIRGKATVRAKDRIGQLEERRTTGAKGDGDALAKPLLPSHVPPPQVLLLLHAFASRPWLREPNRGESSPFSRAPSPSSASMLVNEGMRWASCPRAEDEEGPHEVLPRNPILLAGRRQVVSRTRV